jgi:acyl dehydratase
MYLEKIKDFKIPTATETFTRRDSMLYALGLGYGSDPLDLKQLPYVYEKNQRAVPSMCVSLAYPGFWQQDPSLGIDWVRLLNGEYFFEAHRQLPPEGTVTLESRLIAIDDKGKDKGAAMYLEKTLSGQDGAPYATIRQSLFLRGDGGVGGFGTPPEPAPVVPDRTPDLVVETPTARSAALLYRLNGDYNPVHSDPDIARQAGFREPILHGLCSFGMGCRAIIDTFCDGDPERLRSMSVRFSSPVYPGETLRFEFYRSGPTVQWRARVAARNVVVLDRGQTVCA